MTFNDKFCEWISEQLAEKLTVSLELGEAIVDIPKTINAATGAFFAPLSSDINAVAIMMRAGTAERPKNPASDMISVPYIATIIVPINNAEDIKTASDEIADEYNATFFDIVDDDITYTVQPIFGSCEIGDDPYDLQTDSVDDEGFKITEKVVNIYWTIRVTYSIASEMGGKTYQLVLGTTTYDINGIDDCEFADSQNSMPDQISGHSRISYAYISNSTVYKFLINPIKGDALHTILFSGFIGDSTITPATSILLKIDGTAVQISKYSVNYIESKRIPTFMLTLER